jgi:hypothetical protein
MKQESPAEEGFNCHNSNNNNNNHSELAKLRKEYSCTGIDDENSLGDNPIVVFQKWLNEAIASKVHEPNAMCLATCDLSTGYPSARIVLLKGLDDRGFVWYTNYESRKGQDLQNVSKKEIYYAYNCSLLRSLTTKRIFGFLHYFNHFLPFYSPILDDVEPEGFAIILVG